MPTASVNGIDMWWEFRGPPTAPLLVMTHGFAGPTDHWQPVINDVARDLRLLLYDVRGHGRTSVPAAETFSLPQFAADLAGLLDHLEIEQAHIGGVSMGGMISAQFACDYPERVRSLMLCDTTAGNRGDPATADIEQQLFDVFVRLEAIVRKHGLNELIERENRYRHDGDPHAHEAAVSLEQQDENNRMKAVRMTPEGFMAAARALRERPDLTTRTPTIAAPTQVSCGEWDMFYPLAVRDHALIPGSRFVTVRRAAHDTTTYRPELFKRLVVDFIADVEAGRRVAGEVELD